MSSENYIPTKGFSIRSVKQAQKSPASLPSPSESPAHKPEELPALPVPGFARTIYRGGRSRQADAESGNYGSYAPSQEGSLEADQQRILPGHIAGDFWG